MLLTSGSKCPDFSLPNQDGNCISLNSLSGNKVVLWFYPKASTPGWTIEGQGFRDELKKFQSKNVQIIGMSADSSKRQKNFCDKKIFIF